MKRSLVDEKSLVESLVEQNKYTKTNDSLGIKITIENTSVVKSSQRKNINEITSIYG